MNKAKFPIRRLAAAAAFLALAGCSRSIVLNPPGDVAAQQGNLIVVATVLMLLIIVPVIITIFVFAWRYRASANATYKPDWDHSTQLELLIWAAPLQIIIALGAVTWITTHTLDPYRPLTRLGAGKPVPADTRPLVVDVVSLDWKWLFIYPEQGIATVNELAAPVDRPIEFHLTSSNVMNAFYVPALAGMIYTMPGMETKLHAVMDKPGVYEGFSSNYSGAGFSHMRFGFHALDQAGFDGWVAQAKQGGTALDRATYQALAKPSEREPVRRYATVDGSLFKAILDGCADPTRMCASEMMAIDEQHGAARKPVALRFDPVGGQPYVPSPMCATDTARPPLVASAP